MKFFKPEDFILKDAAERVYVSQLANAKLYCEGKVVYGDADEYYSSERRTSDKTKAVLINIEPIETCTHPKEKVKIKWSRFCDEPAEMDGYRCECGAKLEPLTFGELK